MEQLQRYSPWEALDEVNPTWVADDEQPKGIRLRMLARRGARIHSPAVCSPVQASDPSNYRDRDPPPPATPHRRCNSTGTHAHSGRSPYAPGW